MSEIWRIDEVQSVAKQALTAALPEADLSGRVRGARFVHDSLWRKCAGKQRITGRKLTDIKRL